MLAGVSDVLRKLRALLRLDAILGLLATGVHLHKDWQRRPVQLLHSIVQLVGKLHVQPHFRDLSIETPSCALLVDESTHEQSILDHRCDDLPLKSLGHISF